MLQSFDIQAISVPRNYFDVKKKKSLLVCM